jgi:superfamily II DNA or RNA helicase
MYARYKIGLSGTMQRKDGKHILFKDFFGPKLYQPPQSNTLTPRVQIVKTGIALAQGEPWVKKMNILLYDPDYQQVIAHIAHLQIQKGHKVLIIADRVEFLQNVGELIGEECVCITGGTTYEERTELKRQIEEGEKSCIAGSRQIFSEGISVNILSCVILAGPIANDALLEQIVGRIQRMHPGKLDPLVIDMNFSGPSDRKQNKDRQAFYARKGWEVIGA